MSVLVVLTQYKRNNLEKQLQSLHSQTTRPDYLVVFQNENHIDLENLKSKYEFIHIKSDYNTKYFGRFAACFTFPVEYCIIMDDDIIPGENCVCNYIDQCKNMNAIIGGNGRMGYSNVSRLYHPPDVGIRSQPTLADFVGHLWCFKKEWLHYMFGIKPYTYDTGEDMHFCYSAKVLGNIACFVGKQDKIDDECDLSKNRLANDEHSSYKTTPTSLRKEVEKYFIDNYDLKLIESN